jgi:hypothetical protein
VVRAAARHFASYQYDGAGFVRAVAQELGLAETLRGDANALIDQMRARWRAVSRDEAVTYAERGALVVAALPSSDYTRARNEGHVAVVTPGERYRGVYPRVWSGSAAGIAGQSRGDRSVGQLWRIDDRDRVLYFVAPHGVLEQAT